MQAKRNRLRRALLASSSLLAGSAGLLLGALSAAAQTILPTHGVVASGAASISQSGANMTVNQTSSRAILNWNSFSIGQGDSVTFVQPNASSAVLNRVTGATTSAIAGQLDANGQVYVVNPNGIAITPTGAVQVGGGFVASTLAISDSNFNSGNLSFTGNGASASVDNAGSIKASPGGFVGLIGGSVSDSGTISVPLGKVGLGSGEQATLDLTGDGFLQVAVPTNTTTSDGQALVDISGKVRAAGGSVEIRAATAANAIRNAVNLSGVVSARSAYASGGAVILDGGAGGNVAVTGRISASGRKGGGAVRISGQNVALTNAKIAVKSKAGTGGSVAITAANAVTLAGTTIDASGAAGGGTLAIGGDSHGAGPLANATTTSVDAASVLRADALASGNGGSVTVWSDSLTTFAGLISARGGPQGGDGGSAEVSANAATLGVLSYTGLADLTAPRGAVGTLLLDPFDIVISSGADSGGGFSGGVYTPTSTSVINVSTLETQLASSNVVVSTGLSGSPGPDAGNITVSAPFSWSSNNGLTLTAANAIAINAPISITGAGQLTLNYSTSAPTNLSFGNGANVSYALGSGEGISGQALTINGDVYTLRYSMSDIASMNGGDGFDALATSLTAPTAAFATAVVGSYFGTFEGLGNTITGLKINDATVTGVDGLVGVLGDFSPTFGGPFTGTIRDLGLIGGSVVAGGSGVGALVGINNGGVVINSYATGAVSGGGGGSGGGFGSGGVGGLVGYNYEGIVENSYAIVAVSGGGAGVGGLVGSNLIGGVVESSYATGAVSGGSSGTDVGGLIGANIGGTVQETYATGAVSGGSGLGGLVGYATGGTISNSYWDAQTTGQTTSAGGTSFATAQLQSPSTSGVALGSAFAGGAAGGETAVYPYLVSFFPNGVQAVSGIAYTNSAGTIPLASGVNGAATVSADVNGASLIGATTGANGYYYVFAPLGAIPSGANVVAYTQANATTGAANAATYFVSAGANNSSLNNIYGSTLTETTPNTDYSQLSAGLANAAGADSAALAAIAGVSNINIYATGASFTVDQTIATPDNLSIETTSATAPLTISDPIAISNTGNLTLATSGGTATIGGAISTAAGAITVTGPTVLDPSVTTTGGNITFNNAVTLSANATVNSGAGTTTFAGTVDGDYSLTTTGGVVNFEANVGSGTPLAGLNVTGPVNLFGNVTTSNGAITFNNAVLLDANVTLNSGTATTTFGSTVDSAASVCQCNLTASAGAFSFGGALGGMIPLGAVSLTSTSSMTPPLITATTILAQTTGASANLTLGSGTTLTASAATGTAVTLAAGLGFINESGAGAINLTGAGAPRWLIYSANPADDVFGGLNSNNTAIWDTPFGGAVPPSGDYYVFAYQPTVTFTSTDASKTYGQDVTSAVALDYTVSGVQAGVAGAYLGDTAATAYSGAPSVTSAGSPATASVAGGPYPINVAAGTLSPLNGYALAFASTGTLTVNPEAITITATANTKTYDGTTAAAATPTVTSGTLYDPATLSETYASANAGTGLTLTPKATITNASNYLVTLTATPTGVINPLALTYSVANASSTYGTTATLGAATLTGVLPGDSVSATVGAFSGGAPVTLTPKTPAGVYTEEVTGLSDPNYSIAATGNANGTLTINPLALTYSVANASSTYGTTATLGAATLTGVLPGDSVSATVGAFSGVTQISLDPTTAPGIYSEKVTALSNANYSIATAGNTNGALIIYRLPGVYPSTMVNPMSLHPGDTQLNPFLPFTSEDPGALAAWLNGGGAVEFDSAGWTEALEACGVATALPDVRGYADPLDAVKAISNATQNYFERCRNLTQKDVADALDRYAAALAIIAPRLPPGLRNLPNVVASAAKRVRAAPTKMEAVRILKEAVVEVHKEIALARADNPDALQRQTHIGDLVAGTLDKAALPLERAEGI